MTDWAGRETQYVYDANGRLLQTLRPNGTQQTRRYNAAGALVQQQEMTAAGVLVSQFDFLYDAAGNIRAEQVLPDPTEPLPVQPVTMTYTAANRLATFNGKAVGFDADANLTTGPLNGELDEFSYDSRNRLVGIGKHTGYRYDAENQRIRVSITGQETRYVINPQAALSQVLVKTSPEGKVTFYVYGLGLLGEETDGVYQTYHFDLRGSTVALTDATGKVMERFQYTPYGGLVNHSPALVKTPFLFNGQYGVMTDATGLYYMRARYYHPEIRRFVNQDVLLGEVALGQTLNRFAFVNGRPMNHIDPTGNILTSILDNTRYINPIYWSSRLVDGGKSFDDAMKFGYAHEHEILDAAGMVPIIGEPADALNAVTYAAEGDFVNAGLSCAALWPVGGQAATGAKYAGKVMLVKLCW